MSSQVCAAGSSSVPCPSRLTPTSLMTRFAPSRAIESANSRPMPRPEPVTTATRPSKMPICPLRVFLLLVSDVRLRCDQCGRAPAELLLAVGVGRLQLEVHEVIPALLALAGDDRGERQ